MSFLFSLTPLYLLANLHCLGMCGPIAALLAKNPYGKFYFFGRIVGFTLAGMIAGEMGSVINVALNLFHLPAIVSLVFGLILIAASLRYIFSYPLPKWPWLHHKIHKLNMRLAPLILKDSPLAIFAFGLGTIILPCGQSLMVFSTSALFADAFLGGLNSFFFACLTTPALFIAMKASHLLQRAKKFYRPLMAFLIFFTGLFATFRGLAEINVLPHLIINERLHLLLY